ncbi:ArnT family glycosyltransferase [Aureispira anguillae]|uniref:Glycosyltransferase family 39 protein n=1 Tax=Aureispira anguillae TaxID=2864201 RepID=A0A915YGI6_9BACT|nr:glycosyltransferase family 39 protein [Aureispira anguillae]BDS12615.1 glycosyltransferase family 39 protein [Aureispira anguillae]
MAKGDRKKKNTTTEKKKAKPTKKKLETSPKEASTNPQNAKPSLFTWDIILVSALVLFVLLVRFNLLSVPFERDEGGFAYMAYQMLEGKTLYSEIYEIKPPLLYLLYALFISVFGHSIEGIHMGLLVFDVAYILLLFAFARYFFDKTIAVTATFAFAILSLSPNLLGFAAHATHFCILFGLIGLFTLIRAIDNKRRIGFFWAGLACGLAFLVKQQAIHFMLFAGFYVIFEFFRQRPINWKEWFLSEVLLVIGSILPYLLVVLYMFINGRFDDFWFYTFTWPSEFATSSETGASYEIFKIQINRVLAQQEWLWYLALGGIVSMFLVKIEQKWRIFTLLFTLFMTFALATGFHFYQHYFVILIPAIALLNGMFVQNTGLFINNLLKVKWGVAIPLVLFIFAWTQIIRFDSDYFFSPNQDKILRNAYGTNPFPESKILGDFIKKYTQPEDEIVIACSEPQIGFYAERKSVTGHAFCYPLVDNGSYMKQLQDEFINDIETKKPRISVYTWMSTSWLNRDTSNRVFKFIEQNHQKHYNLIGVAESIPTRQVQNGPIIYQTAYKWNQEALPYFNQRMQQWQQQNRSLQQQGKAGGPPPSLITIWERRPDAPTTN